MDSRQPDLTRQRILEASFAEIHRQGFQAASVANILTTTGLTKGALYHHFPSKKDLGLAVIDEIIAPALAERFIKPLRETERPARALIGLIGGKQSQSEELIRLGCPLNNLMQEMSPVDEDFRHHLNRILAHWQDAFEEALRRAQMAGEIHREVNCHAVALFIVSAWEGCVGIAKNMQSVDSYRACMSQLQSYVSSLLSSTG
ncbi:MAG TPA: TetR family transcriptional regulator C-terminal domain-containing protein [Thiobacillaceae bacterium]|nr:TetR family transcriptional regulator C-terminal domain-containing protein [Thiobacillaceae bacterium]HNA81459.1 TetR family transcriptional regulator C-terminal domain-containing protein [Thiobacillaceae bacterium]HNF89281.1 TetR family transcriptional regulator C-terminal domain-containing protein [Thiobacillaceae bacterium]HNH88000.1 TetR family transcriptional regulator C-terminal domain-containing protein [Thiobacillaceae bacterium]HNI06709.1 TetR family transcriptional regulator C-term